MDESEKQLLRVVKHYQECLDKYLEARNDAKLIHCLDKLSRLPVKVTHLEQTGVGRTVNGLRKFGGQVSETAKALVMKWKDMVVGEAEEEEQQHENENNEDDEDEEDQEDGYESGEPESSVDEHEEVPVKKETSSSSHRLNESHKKRSEDRHKSKKSKHSNHKRDSDRHNGRSSSNSKHKSSKRKIESDSEDEKHKRKRIISSDDDDDDDDDIDTKHKQKRTSEYSDNEQHSKSKERKHKSKGESENSSKDRRHKSGEKSKKCDSSSDMEEAQKSHKPEKSKSTSEKKDKHRSDSSSKDKLSKKEDSKKKDDHGKKTKDSDYKKEKDKKSSSSSKSKDTNSVKSKEHSKDKHRTEEKVQKPLKSSKATKSGIDSTSGSSFAEALGMCEPSSSKNRKKEKPSTSGTHPVDKEKKDKSQRPDDSVSTNSLKEPVTDPFDLNISSLLPTITPNYRPLGNSLLNDREPTKVLSDYEQLSNIIATKNQRTKVYSGNKTGNGKVATLFELCIRVLQDNIDALEYTGGVPYLVLKPILEKSTPNQLFLMEHHNPYLIEDTDELWQLHCQKAFRNKKREELETWREMYLRCSDEREAKLKALTANIKQAQDKSLPVRTTKLAYVDDVAKPPRNIARKQAKNGTAFDKRPALTPSARLSSLATAGEAGKVAVPNPGSRAIDRSGGGGGSHQAVKPKKAPLMVKSLSLLKNRFRR